MKYRLNIFAAYSILPICNCNHALGWKMSNRFLELLESDFFEHTSLFFVTTITVTLKLQNTTFTYLQITICILWNNLSVT